MVDKQYNLGFNELIRSDDGNQYTCVEHRSKNHSEGLVDDTNNKIVAIHHIEAASECDYVTILDLYLSYIPQDLPSDSRFYLWPILKAPII